MLSRRISSIALLSLAACTTKDARRADTAAPATATLAGAPVADNAAVRQAIEAADARFSAAVVQGDSAALPTFYADDAILMPANMAAVRGHDAIAKTLAGLIASMKPSAFKLQTQDVIVAGDYAIETGSFETTSQPTVTGAKPKHDVEKYVVVWKKQPDGSYKILRDIANSDLPPAK
jgi:ketosteroid isomerase-like protein